MAAELGGKLEFWESEGVLVVTQRGQLATPREADSLCRYLEREVRRTGIRRVVFDQREAVRSDDAVKGRVWAWLQRREFVDDCAVVVASTVRQWGVELTGRHHGLRVRAFGTVDEAVRALRSGQSALRRRAAAEKAG